MSDWRARADEALRGRNVSNNRNDGAAIVPNVPNVPTDPARLLKRWHGKLSQVDHLCTPAGWTMSRWLTLNDAACWLYEGFASQAVREGWSALDLFGVLSAMPHAGGLADRIGDARNLKLSNGRAWWSSSGLTQQFCRGAAVPGLVLFWEL